MFKLCFFVPETHLDTVKQAVFDAGGGRIGNYDSCAWQTRGEGQFRAREGADPFLGSLDRVEKVTEYKVELVCTQDNVRAVIAAMKAAHPYEEPAYDVYRLEKL